MRRILTFLVLAAITALAANVALSSDASKSKPVKARYLVIVPHTAEQCLQALDEINAQGTKSLAAWEFGCKANDHTGYQIVTAKTEDDARAVVPASAKDQAKVVMLAKFTAADLKAFHEQMNATSH